MNKTYDVSNPGASIEITASDSSSSSDTDTDTDSGSGSSGGSEWLIAHIAITGENSSTTGAAFTLSGTGTLRDVYMGDGSGSGTAAVDIPAEHAGTIEIRRVYIDGWSHGFMAGAPGNPSDTSGSTADLPAGQGGSVTVANSYAEVSEVGYQLGSSGSGANGCVAVNANRAFWGIWNETSYQSCNASGTTCYTAGNTSPPERPATISLSECRGECAQATGGPGSVSGSVQPDPVLDPPESCPTTPEDATLSDEERQRQNDTVNV
jgi:hypothetical protein